MLHSAVEKFRSFGDILYQEQRTIYENLAKKLKGRSVVDVGCGIGIGTNILKIGGVEVFGCDVFEPNVKFAAKLFPDILFDTLDIKEDEIAPPYEIIVAIEVIEHVSSVEKVIANLFDSAIKEVYISTPNRNDPNMGQYKPINEHHVKEYTTHEMLDILPNGTKILSIDMKELEPDTVENPVIYHTLLPA